MCLSSVMGSVVLLIKWYVMQIKLSTCSGPIWPPEGPQELLKCLTLELEMSQSDQHLVICLYFASMKKHHSKAKKKRKSRHKTRKKRTLHSVCHWYYVCNTTTANKIKNACIRFTVSVQMTKLWKPSIKVATQRWRPPQIKFYLGHHKG